MNQVLSTPWMIAKAVLFLLLAALAATILVAQHPSWQTTVCVALVAWSASRAYYFAFYVIERYADPSFRYSGIWSAAIWVWARGRRDDARK